MDLGNINGNKVIHNKLKKCEICGRELEPIGLDYLYCNISPEYIECKRCSCEKAQEYWKKINKNMKLIRESILEVL